MATPRTKDEEVGKRIWAVYGKDALFSALSIRFDCICVVWCASPFVRQKKTEP